MATFTVAMISACSSTKFVPEDRYLLDKVIVESADENFDAKELAPYVRQKPNTKWFSLVRIPLATYSLSGRDSASWVNRALRNLGEPPVLYDSLQAALSINDLKKKERLSSKSATSPI